MELTVFKYALPQNSYLHNISVAKQSYSSIFAYVNSNSHALVLDQNYIQRARRKNQFMILLSLQIQYCSKFHKGRHQ